MNIEFRVRQRTVRNGASHRHAPHRGAANEIIQCNTATQRTARDIILKPCAVAHGYKRCKRYAPVQT